MFLASHENAPQEYPERVFFNGDGAATRGYGVCYLRGKYTAASGQAVTDGWGKRSRYVDTPQKAAGLVASTDQTFGNELDFAGIIQQGHDARTGGRWIDILKPGSVAEIYVNESVTCGDFVTCIVGGADVGQWTKDPLGMIGIGCARVMQTRTDEGYVMAELIPWGNQCGLLEMVTLTSAGGAHTFTIAGTTLVSSGALAADATYTLADGLFVGQRKAFHLTVTETMNNDLLITVTNGIQIDGTTALVSMELDGNGDFAILEWTGTKWRLIAYSGTALSAT